MSVRSRTTLIVLFVIVLFGVAFVVTYGVGRHEGPGRVHEGRVPAAVVAERRATSTAPTGGGGGGGQILFGDLHVHTTFSADAFMRSLPLLGGEGAHPPADACDFARFCSGLDFFALTDHAEALTPRHWRESIESVRQCNAVAGDPDNPDLAAFIGFEWSQVGRSADEHYGHRNVIFRDLVDAQLPRRPIAAPGLVGAALRTTGLPVTTQLGVPIREFSQRRRYLDLFVYQSELRLTGDCPRGVDTRELPGDCREVASTPGELFKKLGEWGFPSLVIPHGTTWGFYTPPGYRFDKALLPAQRDPARERLIEVFSGHGNSEEYRRWQEVVAGPDGKLACPPPSADHEPCCHRAGEIIRGRCGAVPAAECERRVVEARQRYVDAGVAGHNTIPGATVEEWRDCGQCRDCFNPTFQLRPGGSVQYALTKGDFSDAQAPYHARYGLIASSDNHSARPGTGYKEYGRREMTEVAGARDEAWAKRIFGEPGAKAAEAQPFGEEELARRASFQLVHLERQASFFLTGGLVAVHAAGRRREQIWEALQRREVYGTSGPRLLLWFDLDGGSLGRRPMGSEVELAGAPRFRVRAVGSMVQLPGCPGAVAAALPADRLQRLCLGECYHPSGRRHAIRRIEVVRLRPQKSPGEPIAGLIEDPWRSLPCPGGETGCEVEFDDPDFVAGGRETAYYVRAIQEPTPAVNGANLRCDGPGCERSKPCFGDYRTAPGDDCLAPNEERAWSSPIWVRHPGGGATP